MKSTRPSHLGFTLAEMMIATGVLVMAITLALTGYVYLISESNKSYKQDELDVEAQISIERIKRDLRLSALDKMYYYPPGPGPYTAVSMPLAEDSDGDGAVDVSTNGLIVWDQTVIYHVWSGNPSQLRKTTFFPRNEGLTPEQMQAQLASVVTIGNGSSAIGGSNASTTVVFENLFSWKLSPKSSTFDGYAPTVTRAINEVLGSAVISNGIHTLQFRLTGKNAASSGYRVGLDTLFATPSHAEREAEALLPPSAVTGSAQPTNFYMVAGSWSGNYQLAFPATATGNSFTVRVPSDMWEETNFRAVGEQHQDTTVLFDAVWPYDFLVSLDGYKYNWQVLNQTGDSNFWNTTAPDQLSGDAVRVVMRGADMENGGWITSSGGRSSLLFRGGTSGNFKIRKAYIAQASTNNPMDPVAGTSYKITFSGNEQLTLGAYGSSWSDWLTYPIDKSRSYLVTFLVDTSGGNGTASQWNEITTPTAIGAYVIDATNSPTESVLTSNWSSETNVSARSTVYALQYMWASYPSNGVYTSRIFDTLTEAPSYSSLAWSQANQSGTSIRMKLRSGNQPDMSDAPSWTGLTEIASSPFTPSSLASRRYVQFQAILMADSSTYSTPRLLSTRIGWNHPTRVAEIGGTFTKGPDYGIFELLLDGQLLKKGVVVDMEIFDYIRSHGTSNRITSAATAEVTPRNTGK